MDWAGGNRKWMPEGFRYALVAVDCSPGRFVCAEPTVGKDSAGGVGQDNCEVCSAWQNNQGNQMRWATPPEDCLHPCPQSAQHTQNAPANSPPPPGHT